MLKVGLTGGIGSGKSTVSSMFLQKGIDIIDADKISRQVLNAYPQILASIRKEFGDRFFGPSGELKRKELGNYIFEENSRKEKLDSIIIPYIKHMIRSEIEKLNKEKKEICIVDAPTLIEHGFHKEMDINILVWVDRNTQLTRLKKRDLLSDQEAVNRINSQMPLDEKRELSDYIIDNTKDISWTQEQFEVIYNKLINLARAR